MLGFKNASSFWRLTHTCSRKPRSHMTLTDFNFSSSSLSTFSGKFGKPAIWENSKTYCIWNWLWLKIHLYKKHWHCTSDTVILYILLIFAHTEKIASFVVKRLNGMFDPTKNYRRRAQITLTHWVLTGLPSTLCVCLYRMWFVIMCLSNGYTP